MIEKTEEKPFNIFLRFFTATWLFDTCEERRSCGRKKIMRKRHANLKDHILRKVGVELGEGITLLRALPLASLVGQKAYSENENEDHQSRAWENHEWKTLWPELCDKSLTWYKFYWFFQTVKWTLAGFWSSECKRWGPHRSRRSKGCNTLSPGGHQGSPMNANGLLRYK